MTISKAVADHVAYAAAGYWMGCGVAVVGAFILFGIGGFLIGLGLSLAIYCITAAAIA